MKDAGTIRKGGAVMEGGCKRAVGKEAWCCVGRGTVKCCGTVWKEGAVIEGAVKCCGTVGEGRCCDGRGRLSAVELWGRKTL